MGEHIYNLNAKGYSDLSFTSDLSAATTLLLETFHKKDPINQILDYHNFIVENKIEQPRSQDEYLMEYVMIGLYWIKYSNFAASLSPSYRNVLSILYKLRSKSKRLKPVVDKFRGKIATRQLLKADKSYELLPMIDNFKKLIHWLDAGKSFQQEVKRLKNWLHFLQNKSPIYIANFFNFSRELSSIFTKIAKSKLSSYTAGVSPFLEKAPKIYMNREDIVFCSRSEDEYLFNMIATEVLNRNQKSRFEKTKTKIVLLPSCMSSPTGGTCKSSSQEGIDQFCEGCSTICQVNEIRKSAEKYGFEMRLIPRHSNFSKYLQQWQNKDVGLIGVSCVLNMLSIGFEMLVMQIPSQFILLNYSGCSAHWPTVDLKTEINESVLFEKLNIRPEIFSNLDMVIHPPKTDKMGSRIKLKETVQHDQKLRTKGQSERLFAD